MCGIAGVLRAEPVHLAAAERDVARMVPTLAHRGPDGSATWSDGWVSLGHTRLSIIDLSDLGCQPMHTADERFALVFNGEIYNYRELRSELQSLGHRFRSQSDSEVLLAAYREWGERAMEKLNGMWAFAIWDRERQQLFASRDRAGKKPLYYATAPDGALYFASEVKALRAVGFRFGINPQAAFDFLAQGTYGHLGASGFFDGVLQLPAGCSMTIRPGAPPVITRYWDLPVVREQDRAPYDDAFRARFRELFTDAVTLRLRSDVPVGATLSGGLDSSAIVTVVNEITGGAPMHLFTSVYPGREIDETPFFEAVVARVARPIVHYCEPSRDGWVEQLVQVVDHQEEPFGDTSILAHFSLMRAAREAGVPVVLSGQGGDELMLGYPAMVTAYLGHLVARGQLPRALREIRAWGAGGARSDWGTALRAAYHALPLRVRDIARRGAVRSMAAITSPALRAQASWRRFADREGRSSFDSYLAQLFTRFSIPHLTHYDDRNAMAFGVEGRMPFLDYRLVELMFGARYEALYSGGFTKRVLRESLSDLLPPLVRDRRDKVGFYTPLGDWMRANAEWVGGFMTRERIEHMALVDWAEFDRQWHALRRGAPSAALAVWRPLILHLWADRFDVTPLARPVRHTAGMAAAAEPLAVVAGDRA